MIHPLVNIGISAARLAGKVLLRGQDQLDNLQIAQKGLNDFATQMDTTAERLIIETIHKAYPEHAILGEESGHTDPHESDVTWIIDPIDGTTNFIHGFGHFCVSIGIKINQKITHGIVYDPIRDELFTASRGHGAQVNGRRMRVSGTDSLSTALLGTGFPFRNFNNLDVYMDVLKQLMTSCAGIRRAGSAALDLAYVAAGRLDGFWETGLKPWDVAAGGLFVSESGGFISTIDGDADYVNGKSLVAGTPKIYHVLLDALSRLK